MRLEIMSPSSSSAPYTIDRHTSEPAPTALSTRFPSWNRKQQASEVWSISYA